MKGKSLNHVQLFVTPWTAAYQAPSSMGFSRQEYWSGVPLPSPMTNLDSILKSRNITLLTEVHIVKTMVFSVVMYGCKSWTIKKAVQFSSVAQSHMTLCNPMDCSMPGFPVHHLSAEELMLLSCGAGVPWTARKSNLSILKEINPEYLLEGLMLKLKLQYFGHLIRRADSFKKIPLLGKTEGRKKSGQQRMR